MAKDERKDNSDVAAQRARLARGEQLEGGWCFDGDRDPDIFRCNETERAVAAGELSVSWDGTKVLNLKTGEMTEGERIERNRPVTLMEINATTGGGAPTAGGDTATTDNAPAGTGRGAGGGGTTARG